MKILSKNSLPQIVPILLTVFSMELVACKTPKMNKDSANCIEPSSEMPANKRNTQILSVEKQENKLLVNMEYASMGKKGKPYLYWNGALMKSLPPKAAIEMGYREEKECANCDSSRVNTTVCFDISSLREKTRKQGLVLLIDGFDKPIKFDAEK